MSATKKSKKATVAAGGAGAVAEDPELCAICLNTYTPIIRKKCVCKYCGGDACSKCIERYLLDGFDDAHCVHCRVNYSDTTLREICTKTYLQNVYFKHRQEVLINREKANLPGLQNAAIRERRKRENNIVIGEIKKEIAALSDKQYDLYTKSSKIYVALNEARKNGGSADEIKEQIDKLAGDYNACQGEIDDLKSEIRKKRARIYGIRAGEAEADRGAGIVKEEEKKKFIRRCTRDGCQGFLSTAWKCAICEYYSCSKCFKVKTQKHDDPHECLKEDVETADLIKKDSKPCPNCGEFIMKSSGCFAKNTPILCWNGSYKMSQDIEIGDELVGDDGEKRIVWNTMTGEDTMYEVKQVNGLKYTVNSKHTLVLKNIENEVIEIVIDDYMKLSDEAKCVLYGYNKNGQITPISVKEVGSGTYYGWSVDKNRKFLLIDGTVLHNCSQMFCISCQTPFDWNTGKIVTSGVIHNPHYFEWLKRNGKSMPRNPADIPCGGYPDLWTLMNRITRRIHQKASGPFYEFFRICLEIQEISERSYRTHLDRATMSEVNIKFLLNDCDEKVWGQKLARLERKRKLDAEVQEVFGAFRMVAVELINRVMNYNEDGVFKNFSTLSIPKAEEFLMSLDVEIVELIKMINGGMEEISKTHNYSVPYIECNGNRYSIKTMNFARLYAKGKRGKQTTKDIDSDSDESSDSEVETETPVVANAGAGFSRTEYTIPVMPEIPDTDDDVGEVDEVDEDKELQKAIEASIKSATKI
jgi:predicted transcriptional regulator